MTGLASHSHVRYRDVDVYVCLERPSGALPPDSSSKLCVIGRGVVCARLDLVHRIIGPTLFRIGMLGSQSGDNVIWMKG